MTARAHSRRSDLLLTRRQLMGYRAPAGASLNRPEAPEAAGYYLRLSRPAMACHFEIFLRPEDRRFVRAAHQALDEVDRLEQQMSVYREDSEISRLNRSALDHPVPVEARLYGLLRYARDIGLETQGAFDITIGPLVRCWGFFKRRGEVPATEDLEAARRATGWDGLAFEDQSCSVSLLKPGVEINLGSIGKGYALDRAAALLRRAGLRDYMIHAGHSSILASGDSNSGPGWEVSIRDPLNESGSLGSHRLFNQGMSTSGAGEQFFTANGRRYGHIIDPRTGWPSTGAAQCSVLTPTAAYAEALSTAFFVMTPAELRSYCERHPQVGTLWIPAQEDEVRIEPFCRGFSLKKPEARC